MMIRGRHRMLPYALDRAIMLPGESQHAEGVDMPSETDKNEAVTVPTDSAKPSLQEEPSKLLDAGGDVNNLNHTDHGHATHPFEAGMTASGSDDGSMPPTESARNSPQRNAGVSSTHIPPQPN